MGILWAHTGAIGCIRVKLGPYYMQVLCTEYAITNMPGNFIYGLSPQVLEMRTFQLHTPPRTRNADSMCLVTRLVVERVVQQDFRLSVPCQR